MERRTAQLLLNDCQVGAGNGAKGGNGKALSVVPQNIIINFEIARKPVKFESIYYMSDLKRAYKNFDEADYFCHLYRDHFYHTFGSMNFCRKLKPLDPKYLQSKALTLPKRPGYESKRLIKKIF
jgi:hypothetical protein